MSRSLRIGIGICLISFVLGFSDTSSIPTESSPALMTAADAWPRMLEVSLVEETPGFSAGKVSFSVQYKDTQIPYHVFGLFVMPGEEIPLQVVAPDAEDVFTLYAETGTMTLEGPAQWTWSAPETVGIHRVHITEEVSMESVLLNVFVMQPFGQKDTALGSFKIGRYPTATAAEDRPQGLVAVTPDLLTEKVAPHFTLGQFLCKQQETGFPRYTIVQERLVLKLESLLAALNEAGFSASTLTVMSSFRTPYYHRLIGNRTTRSQHLYGGAADVYLDVDENRTMDDLNGDGRINLRDARWLADLVETVVEEEGGHLEGGLGLYGPKPHRGPFIHVDVRGQRVRW